MPGKFNSPYATSFKSAVRRGTSYNVAVNNIAKRWKKTPEYVWESLFKAGHCYRQKFNGQWIYWPCNVTKAKSVTWKNSQFNMWQWFCEWCLTNGFCTPQQLNNYHNQKQFMTFCRKFFGKQYNWTTTTKTRKTRKTTRRRKTTTKGKTYKFPMVKGRTTTRKYRRAA